MRKTLEEYDKLPSGIIATGIISNSPTGCFMTRDGNIPFLYYVVVKDPFGWCVFFGRQDQNVNEIAIAGDISTEETHIRRAFPCTDELYKLYIDV